MKTKYKMLISSLSVLVMLTVMVLAFPTEPARATHADSAIEVIRFQEGNTDFAKVTFEGGGNMHAIRTIDIGFSILNLRRGSGRPIPVPAYDWWVIIDKDAGGSGNFANEPSPSTTAFTPDTEAIGFGVSQAISGVMLYYSSYVPVELVAYDINNTIIASASGRVNYNLGQGDPTGFYTFFDPIKVEVGQNLITSVWLFGAPGQFGLDDLTVSRKRPITDTTAPIITPGLNGTLGNNGWYTSTVSLSWTVTDPESPISPISGCGSSSVTYDTGGVTFTCTATSAGGTASKSVTIKRDATPPSVVGSRSPGPNYAGWNNSDVTVSFSGSDALSGIATCTGPVILSAEGAGQSVSGSCTDGAGNSASTSVSGINIDKTPPYSVSSLSGTMGGNGWYISAVQVSLGAGDKTGGTGASKIEYSLDGVNLNTYTGPFTIVSEGTTTVYYRAWDYAGNVESTKTTTFKIDKTPPTSTATLAGTQGTNGWYVSDVQVTLSSSDKMGGSGVNRIEYSLDGVNLKTYSGPFSVTAEGSTTVYYRSWDAAGNVEVTRTVALKIDKTAPSASGSVSPGPNTNGWNNASVVVSFGGNDSLSGIASCSPAVTLSSEGTGQSASGTCTDKAGNVSAPTTASNINIDLTKPALVFGAITPAPNANGWNSSDVTIAYIASDTLSGIASSSRASPLSFTTEGSGLTQNVIIVDKAGNSANFVSPAVSLDKTKPTATASASPGPNANGWNNSSVVVSFSGSDSLAGIASCSPAVTLSSEGAGQSASGTCTDKAGNISAPATASNINIDKTAPTITGSRTPAPNANGWNNTDVTASFLCSDVLSGIASCSPPTTVTAEGANKSVTGTAMDKAGNSASATISNISIDKTPPAITGAGTPSPNANGWNNTDVTVSFSCSDGLSGIAACSSPTTLAGEGASKKVTGKATDKAGNDSFFDVFVSIDKKPPTITGGGTPPPNANGWNNTDVTVNFSCSDGLSGIAGCSSPTALAGEGASQKVTGKATDKAGNDSFFDVFVSIDKTKPTIAITVPQAKDYLTSESLTLNFTVSDALSGVASQSATLDGNPVNNSQVINLANMAGSHTLIVSATDKAGNSDSKSVTFNVVIAATIVIDPNTLNIKSQGDKNAVTAYIEFPSGYDVAQINVVAVKLNTAGTIIVAQLTPTSVGDHDTDGVPDRMVKFDRQAVIIALTGTAGNVSLTVTGETNDGRRFTGGGLINVISSGK